MKHILKKYPAAAVFCAALAARLAALAAARVMGMRAQPLEYDVIARNFLEGNGFVYVHLGAAYRSFPNPLYPWLCILFYKVFGYHQLPLLVAQSAFSALLCVAVYYIGRRIDERTGILAAVLTMLHPGIFYYNLFYLHGLTLDAFLFALIVLMFMRLKESPSGLNQAGAGAALGLEMFERGTVAFFVPLALVWLRFFQDYRDALLAWVRRSAVVVAVAALIVLPYVVRNSIIHRQPVGICTTLAEVLWRGNNPLATGTAYAPDGTPVFFAAPAEFRERITSLDEIGQMRAFRAEALRHIRQSPRRFVLLTLEKMRLFWWFSPFTGIEYGFRHLWIVKLLYAVMYGFAAAGLVLVVKAKRRADLAALVALLCLAVTVGQSFFYVQQKHRWALEPLIFIFVAHALVRLARRARVKPPASSVVEEKGSA